MDNWTAKMVEDRLIDAAQVMRRLPPVRAPGYFNTWPPMVVEFADRVGQQPEPMRLPPPSPAAISGMKEALGWLRWLEAEDAKLVWARAAAGWLQSAGEGVAQLCRSNCEANELIEQMPLASGNYRHA